MFPDILLERAPTLIKLVRWTGYFYSLCPLSYSDLHHTPEGGTSSSTPRGTAETTRVTSETTGWAGRTGAEDERAADGQWEQTERAGGLEEGL